MPTHARDRLVQAAEHLFYAEGIRAVGVERLLTVSGVGRASFYRHFSSKDDLVVAMLRGYDQRWRRVLAEGVTERGNQPLAVFDVMAERFESADFRGCASINAMVELADPDSPGHQVAAEHKRLVIEYLDGLLAAAGHDHHATLAEQFMLLMDGAMVTALRERTAEPAHRAKAVAAALLATSATAAHAG
ncbi:TetR/AcrR family transcriptional regulator [Goodfellowiella coeruleoviolacea]|uniref:Transcriptional regulator, TetR family n=1 Tax=Goodfellowiella coeruleoviolacea TaxID=334858 RepID=A0AAE3KH39_9PSEU|nr:TetR/AcrR family transcriptional regulator [Goodfellowiella coeruleoviolacea]MCP2167916.1 transcriptional regulator, TetR family [Goodfellowiella coeruleoviolacea]